jgi:hypothetical protein
MTSLITIKNIESLILLIRGQKVVLDSELAKLYNVPTYRLNEQVKRNTKRFPPDFMFQLNNQELTGLTSQFAMSNTGRGGRRHLPFAFTEQGVAMLSSVLNSERAIQVNVAIMRAFVQFRQLLTSNQELSKRLDILEMKYDGNFKIIFDAIRKMMTPPVSENNRIGFLNQKP